MQVVPYLSSSLTPSKVVWYSSSSVIAPWSEITVGALTKPGTTTISDASMVRAACTCASSAVLPTRLMR
jgi:hypothetical protein